MASRKEQKEAARLAREQRVAQMKASQSRRTRTYALGGILAVVIAAAAVLIIVSSSGNGGGASTLSPKANEEFYTPKQAKADAESLLNGIPEHGNVLGDPNAPVTITEFGDLVCSTCDEFAVTSEPLLINDEVRDGNVKLVYRAAETSSGYANGSEFVNTQVAARAAGLQQKEWYFLIILYDEQPHLINGKSAELSKYVTTSYLQNRAAQVPGLNLIKWQENLVNQTLINDVHTDLQVGQQLGVDTTPTVFVKGPKGTIQWDKGSDVLPATNTALSQLKSLIKQVS
ncbi:MAG TPA: thioredoxin domain-containing protein [Solirubrobacteraceae bacterium]|nr:thioredoxin domain-containing protein [Solirubrobacteraceae bacterium]